MQKADIFRYGMELNPESIDWLAVELPRQPLLFRSLTMTAMIGAQTDCVFKINIGYLIGCLIWFGICVGLWLTLLSSCVMFASSRYYLSICQIVSPLREARVIFQSCHCVNLRLLWTVRRRQMLVCIRRRLLDSCFCFTVIGQSSTDDYLLLALWLMF